MAERYSSFAPGGTAWLLQRVTAAFLVVVLAFHFFLLHFVNHAAEIEFAGTQARMENVGYFLTMVSFLVAGTFHGVNGVYNALINQGLDGTQKKSRPRSACYREPCTHRAGNLRCDYHGGVDLI